MLKTVRDACTPHPMVFELAVSDQIEDLATVIGHAGDGAAFYQKNYITGGMRQLFELGLRRLAGRSDQAVFELTQAMGGGKTHTMIAFGLLAKNEQLRRSVVPDIASQAPFDSARVVAISGRRYPEHFLWGEVAHQLGEAEQFRPYWQHGAAAPDEAAWIRLIGSEPTLLLLDELPPYFDYAVTRSVGGGTLAQVATAALSNLFSAALKLPRLCIVVSNLSGTYEGASKDLRRAIRNVEQEARRQAKPITPVELGSDEIYQILKKRLFSRLPASIDTETVSQAYAQAVREAEKARSISKSTEQIASEVHQSYPFHPSIKDIIALFRNNESYRQTRGLMQFVAKLIRSVWNRSTNDVHLIGLQHLDLKDPEVRDELSRICDLRGAIATDISGGGSAHAETIDGAMSSDAGTQVATLLLSASLSTAVDAVRGMNKQRLLECLIAPNRSVLEFSDAFEHLKSEAWYLHRDAGELYYFSSTENLTKRLASEAERAPQNKIDAEMRRRLEQMFEPRVKAAYQELKALPVIADIKLSGPRVLLILSPDTRNPPDEAGRFYESITEKNNLCVLTGDGSDIASLDEKTRVLYAVAKLQQEFPPGSPQYTELAQKQELAEHAFHSTVLATFNRVWFPTRQGLTAARLAMSFEANSFDGELEVQKALASTAASKLVLDVQQESVSLITRAEDLLWPENQRRAPWRDIRQRAISNPRWTWLPKDGLDQLRKIAEQRGAWRSTPDGYVEKGPFEKPKTTVLVQERGYDDATGEASLEVTPLNAGANPQVFCAEQPNVTRDSRRLTDSKLTTDATRLWFLAVAADGEYETGEAVAWCNRLTITHQPRMAAGTRLVELKVVPRGQLRYTLTGANPAEGTPYGGPIDVGLDAVTVCCHAEDRAVTARREFHLPPVHGEPPPRPPIDPDKPAALKLSKLLETHTAADTFGLLLELTKGHARLVGPSLELGQGSKTASLRFGSTSSVTPAALEATIAALRASLEEELAEPLLKARAIWFETGRDAIAFIERRGLQPNEYEVVQ